MHKCFAYAYIHIKDASTITCTRMWTPNGVQGEEGNYSAQEGRYSIHG